MACGILAHKSKKERLKRAALFLCVLRLGASERGEVRGRGRSDARDVNQRVLQPVAIKHFTAGTAHH
jgi:hypothetical protein